MTALGPGDDGHRQAGVEGGAHQAGARVADQRHPGVADQGDARPGLHAPHDVGAAAGLVVPVEGDHRHVRAGVPQQRGRAPGVLARDQVGLAQVRPPRAG